MKIGILTQPLLNNYGGILQAFALQKTLAKLGHTSIVINRQFPNKGKYKKILSIIFRLIKYIFVSKKTIIRVWTSKKEENIINQHFISFISNHINTSKPIKSNKELKSITKQNFDAYIVGSDQVWRPKYSPCLENYFLDFLDKENKSIKISYAASFGVDSWELSPKETKKCSELIKKFDAVSVRENSGVDLCRDKFNFEARLVLDPTLLLGKEEYENLILNKDKKNSNGLFIYFLDLNEEKKKISNIISKKLSLREFFFLPNIINQDNKKSKLSERIYPSISEWLSGLMNSEFILTDSFHGTVFSIIFNKPFLSVVNEGRGKTRFISLLKIFNLEERLIYSINDLTIEKINSKLDFDNINKILYQKKIESINFITNVIK